MTSEISKFEPNQLSAKDIQAQINLIQEVMAKTMKEGVHYGAVPGCGDKPALLKPGAEKILATFRLSADPVIEDLSTPDEIRYRIKSEIRAIDGSVVGFGVGEASSDEEKYKWRSAVCDEEFTETPEDRKRSKWKKGWQNKPNTKISQVRTNIADIANTVLKMAKKRSLVDGCLTTTACSDIFEQDIEDLGGVIDLDRKPSKPGVKPTQSKSEKPADKKSGPDPADSADKVITKIATVTTTESKPGAEKQWVRYHITSVGGTEYKTFHESIKKDAEKIAGTDVEAHIYFNFDEKFGNTIVKFMVLEG